MCDVSWVVSALVAVFVPQRIHWHEFLAAAVDHCNVDDVSGDVWSCLARLLVVVVTPGCVGRQKYLRLAFERLDHEDKGFISKEDVEGLMGEDAEAQEVSKMFEEAKANKINMDQV